MATDFAAAILGKIGEYLVSPIAHQLEYLFHYNKNIEVYRNQLKKLGNMKESVQQLVDVARRNEEEIRSNVTNWLAEVDDIIEKAGDLDERINANKGCLNGWCPQLSSMYKLSREVTKKTLIVMQLQGDVPGENVSLPAPPPPVGLVSNPNFVTAASSESTMNQIMELLHDDGCDIIWVYGMGGIGKTTLVKEVGKKAQKIFDQVVMAVVSQTLNLTKIQDQIADMLGMQLREASEQGRAGRLYARLKNEKKILIILDDVWTNIDLTTIGIPHGADHKGCKVIVTTRRESVCSAMGNRTKKILLSLLSPKESWDLFRENAGAIVDSSMLNGVAMEVAKECCGLPLALVTVGRALHDKDLEEWKSALKQLKKSTPLTIVESEERVFSCIKLSYDYIKKDKIKEFFLFCCLFPEDYEIAIETLARFGMGKGLFTDTDIIDTMDDARSRAHDVTKYLKASCLLLDGGFANYVKMHDVVRDVGISIVSTEKNNSFLIRAGVGLKEWPNRETFEHYTTISLMCNDFQKLPEGLNCPNLQILLQGMNGRLEDIPDAFCKGMPALRVLDLSQNMRLLKNVLPLTLPPSFEFLAQLRTLHLDCCKFSSSISILGKLRKLEILSLARSHIEELPKEIGELINLRLLDLSRCDVLKKIPANVISSLTQLEELYMGGSFWQWAVEGTEEEKTSACLSELKSLPRLLILCVDLIDPTCFPRQLLVQNLLKYRLSIGIHDYTSESYPTSRSLRVQTIETPLPGGIKTLFKSNLVEADLSDLVEGSMNEIFDVDGGGGPIGLKSLKLINCDNMFSLRSSKNSSEPSVMFTSLEELSIWRMKSMSFISDSCSDASFSKLRELNVQMCERLKFLFSYSVAQSLLQLETLVVKYCVNLERIIAEAEEEEGGASSSSSRSSHTQPIIAFPNLRAGEITFPKLKSLSLQWLPSLKRLCSETSSVNMPCLEELWVYDCPMMENLSTDPAAYGLKSAPKLSYLEVDGDIFEGESIQKVWSGK